MLFQTEARIYLESQRGRFQTDVFRSLRILNFDDYQAKGREPIGKLLAVNDETLLAEQSHIIVVDQVCQVILLPVVGGIELTDNTENVRFVSSGETLSFTAMPGTSYTLTNPYEQEAINYLQIRLEYDANVSDPIITRFDLTEKNKLLRINHNGRNEEAIYVGKYGGREEGELPNETPNQEIFAFVIEGAFEIQNRLLENRDALFISGTDKIEFEALSNDAVILVIAT